MTKERYKRNENKKFRKLAPIKYISAIIAVIIGAYELRSLELQREVNAWTLLTANASGNSGKGKALEYLNSEFACLGFNWLPDGVSKYIWHKNSASKKICWKEAAMLSGIEITPNGGGEGAYLQNINMESSVFSNALFVKAQLEFSNFDSSMIFDSKYISSGMANTSFNEAWLHNTMFDGTSLRDCSISRTDLYRSQFSRTAMVACSVQASTVRDTTFIKSDLSGVKFNDSKFSGNVSFRHSLIEGADFTGASGLTKEHFKGAWVYNDPNSVLGIPEHVREALRICSYQSNGFRFAVDFALGKWREWPLDANGCPIPHSSP